MRFDPVWIDPPSFLFAKVPSAVALARLGTHCRGPFGAGGEPEWRPRMGCSASAGWQRALRGRRPGRSVKDELKELQSDELVYDHEGVEVWWTASMLW